jgi:hypothetical protein
VTTDEEAAMKVAFFEWIRDHDWDGTEIPVVPGEAQLWRAWRSAWRACRRYLERQGGPG